MVFERPKFNGEREVVCYGNTNGELIEWYVWICM
jgi:hypothetical protein